MESTERIPISPDDLLWLAVLAIVLVGIPRAWKLWKEAGAKP